MAIHPLWTHDDRSKKLVFNGKVEQVVELLRTKKMITLEILFDSMGLWTPVELRSATVEMKEEILLDAVMTCGMDQFSILEDDNHSINYKGDRQVIQPTSLSSAMEAISVWRSWLETTPLEEREVCDVISDVEIFMSQRCSEIRNQLPNITDSQIATGFIFSYEFAESYFWVILTSVGWKIHFNSSLIELNYVAWESGTAPRNVLIGEELIDFKSNTSAVSVIDGQQYSQILRISSNSSPYLDQFNYSHAVWWGVGNCTIVPSISRQSEKSNWHSNCRTLTQWEEAPNYVSVAVEYVWSFEETSRKSKHRDDQIASVYIPSEEICNWCKSQEKSMRRASRRSFTLSAVDNSTAPIMIDSTCLNRQRSSSRSQECQTPLSRKSSRRSGSVVGKFAFAEPPVPKSVGDYSTWISPGDSSILPVVHHSSSTNTPPLVMLLLLEFSSGIVSQIIETLETICLEELFDDIKPTLLISYPFKVVIEMRPTDMVMYRINDRLMNKKSKTVASLLLNDFSSKAAECGDLVDGLLEVAELPFTEQSYLKQVHESEKQSDGASFSTVFRKGKVLLSDFVLPTRRTVDCLLSTKSKTGVYSRDDNPIKNIEIIAGAYNISILSRVRRRNYFVLPKGTYEVVSDDDSPILRQISTSEIVRAQLRQLLTECNDIRLVLTLGTIINNETHIKLRYTDPLTSTRRVRIDKQPHELPGLSNLIPIVQPYCRLKKVEDDELSESMNKNSFDLFDWQTVTILQQPHHPKVVAAEIVIESGAERVGLKPGCVISKVNGFPVHTVTHAESMFKTSLSQTYLAVEITAPNCDYGIWQVRKDTSHYTVLQESAIIDLVHQQGLSELVVDAAFRGTVVILQEGVYKNTDINNDVDSKPLLKFFSEKHIPQEILEKLLLEFPSSTTADIQWLQGDIYEGETATIVGSLKIPKFLTTETKPNRKPTKSHRLPTNEEISKMKENARYQQSEYFTEALEGFRSMQTDITAVQLISNWFLEIKYHRLGVSSRLCSLQKYSHWYEHQNALAGKQESSEILYYCVSIDKSNRLLIVHHSQVKVKDVVVFDLLKLTRITLINGDHSRWMADLIRRLPCPAQGAIGDDGVELLSRALALNPSGVQHLSLEGNNLTDDCIPSLVSLLVFNPNILTINIDDNKCIKHINKRSLSCLIRCNSFECELDHEDLDFLNLVSYVAERRETILPAGDTRIILAKNALGVLCQKAAQHEVAEGYFTSAWELAEARRLEEPQSISVTHMVTTILYSLGTLHLSKGDLSRGRDVFLRSFQGIMSVAGPNHCSVWQSLSKIAGFYAEQRELEKTLFWYNFIVGELVASQGPRCPLVSEIKQKIAAVHIHNGNTHLGIYELLHALHTIRCNIEIDELSMFECLHKLAEGISLLSHPAEELAINEQALFRISEAFKERRIKLSALAECTISEANYYHKKAQSRPPHINTTVLWQKARVLYQDSYDHYAHLVPERHPDFISLIIKSAAVLVNLDGIDFENNKSLTASTLHTATTLTSEVLSYGHPLTANALRWNALFLHRLGEVDKALTMMREARDQLSGSRTDTLASILHDHGKLCTHRGLYKEGEESLLNCLKIRETLYGTDNGNAEVSASMLSITELYIRMGLYEEAEDYSKRYLTMQLHRYPESLDHFIHAMGVLAKTRKYQGKLYEYQEMILLKSVVEKEKVNAVHGKELDLIKTKLRNQLKNLGAIYLMKETSWNARMVYINTKQSRSYPLELLKSIPPYNPFKRSPGVPLSSIDQAMKLKEMSGLYWLVRYARITDPGQSWDGIKGLERAVVTSINTGGRTQNKNLDEEGRSEIRPSMFGSEDVLPVWVPPKAEERNSYHALLDKFLSGAWESNLTTEDPIYSSLNHLVSLIQKRSQRNQQILAEQLSLSTTKGTLLKYWKCLRDWESVAKGIREAETGLSQIVAAQEEEMDTTLDKSIVYTGRMASSKLPRRIQSKHNIKKNSVPQRVAASPDVTAADKVTAIDLNRTSTTISFA